VIEVRPIRPGEGKALWEMLHALAASHNFLDNFQPTPEGLEAALFGPGSIVGCLLAECDGELAGCAFWHRSFSTFRGCEVMYLEDLSVLPAFQKRGVGRKLLEAVARLAVEKGYPSIFWVMMDWNEAGRALYSSVGAEIEPGVCYCRIHGEALMRLAA
jgi:GNAT superfamily N-acetyltransferase